MAFPLIFRRLFQDDGKGVLLRPDIIPTLPSIPAGGIINFTGTFGGSDGKHPIPLGTDKADDGWALCDGTNDTPDLRGRFIIGVDTTYPAGATGGVAHQVITASLNGSVGGTTLSAAQMPHHNHGVYVGPNEGHVGDRPTTDATYSYSTSGTGGSGAHSHGLSGTATGNVATIPPYYALAYIMKL